MNFCILAINRNLESYKKTPKEIKNRFPNQMVNMLSVCSRPCLSLWLLLACFTLDAWKTCSGDRDETEQGSVRQPGLKRVLQRSICANFL